MDSTQWPFLTILYPLLWSSGAQTGGLWPASLYKGPLFPLRGKERRKAAVQSPRLHPCRGMRAKVAQKLVDPFCCCSPTRGRGKGFPLPHGSMAAVPMKCRMQSRHIITVTYTVEGFLKSLGLKHLAANFLVKYKDWYYINTKTYGSLDIRETNLFPLVTSDFFSGACQSESLADR